MIKEDYVSFKIAKLLREKGFNEQCREFYRQENGSWLHRNTYEYHYFNLQMPRWEDCYACPTLAMAMKWLREVHKLQIEFVLNQDVENEEVVIKNYYHFNVSRLDSFANEGGDCEFYNSYEEACEAAIKYCLENLI